MAFGCWMRRRTEIRPARLAIIIALLTGTLFHSESVYTQPAANAGAVTEPTVVRRVDAIYPASPVGQNRGGEVVLAVTVGTDGRVTAVEVLDSIGPDFDEAAMTAARQWAFRPAMRGDRAVASRIRVPFTFVPPAPIVPAAAPSPSAAAPSAPAAALSAVAPATSAAPTSAAAPATSGLVPSVVVGSPPPTPSPATPTLASSSAPQSEHSPDSTGASSQQPASSSVAPLANDGTVAAAHAHDSGGAAHETPLEINVHGRMIPPSRGASDFNLRLGDLARVPRQNAAEILKLAPGILLTNEGGEGHAEQVFLRGFDAREGQDIEFSVGGVPINESGNLHGNGHADTHFIIPELVQSLRVIEGPFDPRQGNFAVAGSANYELGLENRGLTAKYTNGSWGTQRLVLTWGPKGQSGHTFAAGELSSTNGYGQNRDAQRGSVMGQYEGRLGERGLFRVFAQGYSTHYHSAGVLRADDYEKGRIGFYDSYDLSQFARSAVPAGGDSARYSVAGSFEMHLGETALTQQIFAIKRTMRLVENFTGYLLDVQSPLQRIHLQRGDGLDLNVDESTVGARGAARLRETVFGQRQELELGYFARADWVEGTCGCLYGGPKSAEVARDRRARVCRIAQPSAVPRRAPLVPGPMNGGSDLQKSSATLRIAITSVSPMHCAERLTLRIGLHGSWR